MSIKCNPPLTTYKAQCICAEGHTQAFEICCPSCDMGSVLFCNPKTVNPTCLLSCYKCGYTFCSFCCTMIHSSNQWDHLCELPINVNYPVKNYLTGFIMLLHVLPKDELYTFSKKMMFLIYQYKKYENIYPKISDDECLLIRMKFWQMMKRDLKLYHRTLQVPQGKHMIIYITELMMFQVQVYSFSVLWYVHLTKANKKNEKKHLFTGKQEMSAAHPTEFIRIFHINIINDFLGRFLTTSEPITVGKCYLYWFKAFANIKDYCDLTKSCPRCLQDFDIVIEAISSNKNLTFK